MSQYLKGIKKDETLEKIKKFLAFRLTDEEILNHLEDEGIKISERTLRRFKILIRADSGISVADIFRKNVVGNLVHDITSFEEIQKECWKLFHDANNSLDKIRALSLLRNSSTDKLKILNYIPRGFRSGNSKSKSTKKYLMEIQNECDKILGPIRNHPNKIKEITRPHNYSPSVQKTDKKLVVVSENS